MYKAAQKTAMGSEMSSKINQISEKIIFIFSVCTFQFL